MYRIPRAVDRRVLPDVETIRLDDAGRRIADRRMHSATAAYGEAFRWTAWSLPTTRRTRRRDAHGNQLFTEGCGSSGIRCVRRGACDRWDRTGTRDGVGC